VSAIERKFPDRERIQNRNFQPEQGRETSDPAPWYTRIDLSLPFWIDYVPLIARLRDIAGDGPDLPRAGELQKLLPPEAVNQSGKGIVLTPATAIPGVEYERHIFLTAQVSTRQNNWHDLFNALVWARFPRLKSAMNALHHIQIGLQNDSRRSRLRDALTLLDECGVIVASANRDLLSELASRNWNSAFCRRAACWGQEIQIFVCGHALLEKFLNPYKSLTAHAVLAFLDRPSAKMPRDQLLRALDVRLGAALIEGGSFNSPADLSPLPLMGIPGWWPRGTQGEAFYADGRVFRQPQAGARLAPVFGLRVAETYQAMP